MTLIYLGAPNIETRGGEFATTRFLRKRGYYVFRRCNISGVGLWRISRYSFYRFLFISKKEKTLKITYKLCEGNQRGVFL